MNKKSEKIKKVAQEASEIVNQLEIDDDLREVTFREIFRELVRNESANSDYSKLRSRNKEPDDNRSNGFFIKLSSHTNVSEDFLKEVYDYTDEDFNLIVHPVPGKSKSAREKNAARLILAGYSLGLDRENVSARDLKSKLENIGLGTTNLSRNMRALRSEVVISGNAPHLKYKLTVPGRQTVKDLLFQIKEKKGEK